MGCVLLQKVAEAEKAGRTDQDDGVGLTIVFSVNVIFEV